ncbi:GNAT family N-acetyltransferase [Naasia lichenicola]|nr:GNAT family N-acetyltransferase [Naasia lichenicola]
MSTRRLILRPHRLRHADAEAWHHIVNQPDVRTALNWPARDRAASRRHLEHRTRHTRLWQADDFLALAIELDGELIGDVSLHVRSIEGSNRSAEIGWLLDRRNMGCGYATEAASAMLALAFDVLQAQWVTAIVRRGNPRSAALAKRLGFTPVAADGQHDAFLMGNLVWRERGAEVRTSYGIDVGVSDEHAVGSAAAPLGRLTR